jgi:hypothetical protein
MDTEIPTNVPESEPLAETQTEEIPVPEDEVGREPINTVNTFWERLDVVLDHLESEPVLLQPKEAFKSALNQPRQIFVCSTQDTGRAINGILQGTPTAKIVQTDSFFDSFRVSFKDRSLLNVKSIQLYSASIPQAQTNITDSEIVFWFYKLEELATASLGAWSAVTAYDLSDIVTYSGRYYGCYKTRSATATNPSVDTGFWYDAGSTATQGSEPNYLQLLPSIRANCLFYFYLEASYEYPNDQIDFAQYGYNKTFTDYDDLLTEVNLAAGYNSIGLGTGINELYFQYNARFNKFQVYPVVPDTAYYFFPAFGDTVYQELNQNYPLNLNLRLGFTKQLNIPIITSNPWTNDVFDEFKKNLFGQIQEDYIGEYYTAESYANLNYTNRCNVFADFCRTSSFDTFTGGELLASVPMNTGNLGIVLYQAVYDNRLNNVPPEIYDIFFYFETDNKIPYLFPKSATISLELALEYF